MATGSLSSGSLHQFGLNSGQQNCAQNSSNASMQLSDQNTATYFNAATLK